MSESLRVLEDMVCLRCGCLCDDISVTTEGETIQSIARACSHGKEWFDFGSRQRKPGSETDTLACAAGSLEQIAELLSAARYPIFIGLEFLSVEAQREAIGLADDVGAIVDVPVDHHAAVFPRIGEVSCTWGEVRDRADLIVYWRCKLGNDHWRHEELILNPAKRRGATVHFVDPSDGWRAAWAIRGSLRGISGEFDAIGEAMRTARYGVIVHDGSADAIALRSLAVELNRTARFRVLDLGRPGNVAGLRQVVGWQTGYHGAVGLHRSYPVSCGNEFMAEEVLRRGEADMALVLGAIRKLSEVAERHLAKTPQTTLFADVDTACQSGTVFRSDGLTVSIRSPFSPSFPDPVRVLKSLRDATRLAMKR